MKNIILAAGYATRLGELTKNFPKPLLKIGNNTILGRMLDDIDTIDDITEHIIVTNHKFAPIFKQWAAEQHYSKPITIVDDGTETNETRLGAVNDLLLVLNTPPKQGESEGVLVVAADNLLFFSFQEFVDFAKAKGTSCIMCHEQPSIEKLQRTGVVELDANNKVLGMEEKPQVPKSHWAGNMGNKKEEIWRIKKQEFSTPVFCCSAYNLYSSVSTISIMGNWCSNAEWKDISVCELLSPSGCSLSWMMVSRWWLFCA